MMTALGSVNVYLCANLLLVLAAALLESLRGVSHRLQRPVAYRHQLRLGQALALAALLLPLLGAFSGRSSFVPQTAQVWSAPTLRDGELAAPAQHGVAVSFGSSGAPMTLDVASRAAAILLVVGLLYVLARLARDAAITLRIIADAQSVRRHRSARVLASDRICVPFSFWVPGRYFIVVPSALVLRGDDLRLAIRHEAQHHRQQDTKFLYLHQLLKAAFFWNPAVHRLERQLCELQEFSCDEALGSQRSISARDYCRCLLRVGEAALRQRHAQLHAGMIGGGAGKLLKRRVEALLARPPAHLRASLVFAAGVAALALMATTALAFTSTIRDRRISVEDADRMAASARQGSTFPITVNESVVRELNLLLSTPDGRAYVQASLGRMHTYEAFIYERLVQRDMPFELLAVPLAEAGYRNQAQGPDPRRGAGLWMFVESTAQSFGLSIDEECDQRLDVGAATDAAIRLFTSLYRQYGDWGLALLAYNAGSLRVDRAIAEAGSRDVWTLIAQGHENDAGYVPRVMAMILIMQNPSVVD